MNVLVRSKVGRRFIGLFLLLSLPVIAAAWFGIWRATQGIREQTHGVLRAASDGAEAQLREFLLCMRRATEALGRDERICEVLQQTNGDRASLNGVLERLKEGLPEAQEVFCISIPKEFQERVFGIFQKGINSTDGTGIGLALVRVAVERMGGRVGVFSEESKGSRFWIDLKGTQ
jgi:hypothetical protein